MYVCSYIYACILSLALTTYLYAYTDPIIDVEVNTTDIPAIDQPLTLQCSATTLRGITNRVDIIWTTGNIQVRRINNVAAINNINSSVYNDSFIIPSLNISDIGSIYQCKVLINSISPIAVKANFTIPLPGC